MDRTIAKLRRLGETSRSFPQLADDVAFAVLEGISSENDVDLLEDFCQEIARYRSNSQHLTEFFERSSELTPADADRLAEVLTQAEESVCDGLTLAQFADISNLCAATIMLIERAAQTIKRASETLGHEIPLSSEGVRATQDAAECVSGAPVDLLGLRSAQFENADFRKSLGEAVHEAGEIRESRSKLAKILDLRMAPEERDVRQAVRALSETGLFSWISRDWRKARKLHLTLCAVKRRVNTEQRRLELNCLLDYQFRLREFENNSHYADSLGAHFRGIDTNFDELEALLSWYEQVRKKLGYGTDLCGQLASRILDLSVNTIRALQHDLETNAVEYEGLAQLFVALREISSKLNSYRSSESVDDFNGLIPELTTWRDEIRRLKEIIFATSAHASKTIGDLKKGHAVLTEKLVLEHRINTSTEIAQMLGDVFAGIATDAERVRRTFDVAAKMFGLELDGDLTSWVLSQPDATRYGDFKRALSQIASAVATTDAAIKAFRDIAALEEQVWLSSGFDQATTGEMVARAERANETPTSLGLWLDHVRAGKAVCNDGLAPIVDSLNAERIRPDQLIDTYRFCVFDAIARELTEQHPDLAHFSGIMQDNLREQFVDLDREVIELQRERIASIVDKRSIPQGVGSGPVRQHTEWQLLSREVTKQKRHVPIRQLVRRAGCALQALKPCFMMGPLSVAQYLKPGALKFDLVVMDEASQLKPEDAIGAVARGAQLVVVGDPKQLPPTSFFDRVFDGDGNEEEDETAVIEEAESILDIASWLFQPVRQLRWHYRSRHQSLIAFSNHYFYDDNLMVFPSPRPSGKEFGVSLVHVSDGRWEQRRNYREAEVVADAAIQHMVRHPGESLGIATMNSDQRDIIDDLIERKLVEIPAAERFVETRASGPEPFFVKNLENIQGDERDVVFISFTYGPQPYGPNEERRVMQRFGPINSDVGWRRLNVLFTRAKKRVVAFSSMKPEEIIVGPNARRGVVALRDYLAYARDGILDQPVHTGRPPDSDFEISVANALKQHGFDCEAQLGVAGYFIDIVVRHPDLPGGYVVGIECDGATYHSGKSVRDRDRLRQAVLEDLGWTIKRIWSTDWFRDPEREIQKIIDAIELQRKVDRLKAERFDHRTARMIDKSGGDIEVLKREVTAEAGPELVEPPADAFLFQSYMLTVEEARKKLVELHQEKIIPKYPDVEPSHRLLRKTMLDALLLQRPTTPDEFRTLIPLKLREETDREQAKAYLDDVLDIISDIGI